MLHNMLHTLLTNWLHILADVVRTIETVIFKFDIKKTSIIIQVIA